MTPSRHHDSPSPTGEGFTICEEPEHMHIARAAEAMAAAIDVMCHRKLLDPRSFPADARLMLGDPLSEDEAVEVLKRYRPRGGA